MSADEVDAIGSREQLWRRRRDGSLWRVRKGLAFSNAHLLVAKALHGNARHTFHPDIFAEQFERAALNQIEEQV